MSILWAIMPPLASPSKPQLVSKVVGALPIVNHVLQALELDALLEEFVPADARSKLAPALGLGILLRNLLISREPLYSLAEWSARCEEELLGLPRGGVWALNDDRLGRCLDKLFMADRAALMTAVVVRAVRTFGLSLDELHNDSTTVTFEGDYAQAQGQVKSGRTTARITHGHNKDHRPDLKQLLFNLTTSADGTIPVWCSVEHGNTPDDKTHIGTWTTLCQLVGRSDFLYVADSKLCTRDNMQHLDSRNGRFVTVLPRTRGEVEWFQGWKKKYPPQWVELLRQPNSRSKDGPDEVYHGVESPIPSMEGFRIVWIHSSQKQERDVLSRQRRVTRATDELAALAAKLSGPKTRKRDAESVKRAAQAIVSATQTEHLITFAVETREEDTFKQSRPGRPSQDTAYVRVPKVKLVLHFSTHVEAMRVDAEMDGIFPLITNDTKLTAAQVLAAYKHQPALERRHEQLKTVLEVMPVLLKNSTRVEALLFLYFLALLVHAVIERQLRQRMKEEDLAELPLYPEGRGTKRPTADRVFRVFDEVRCHRLLTGSNTVGQTFTDELSERQKLLLRLLGIPPSSYFSTPEAANP
jgi:transposase